MRYLYGLFFFIATQAQGSSVSVPWQEFKQLYDEHQSAQQSQPKKPYYSIESTDYSFSIKDKQATGEVSLQGRWIQGQPTPILLSTTMAITKVSNTMNGHVLQQSGKLAFLPEKSAPFSLTLNFALPIEQDDTSSFITIDPVIGLQNRLKTTLEAHLMLLEKPGVSIDDTTSFLQHSGNQRIRFSKKMHTSADQFNLLTTLRVEQDKLIARLWLKPKKAGRQQTLSLVLPNGAQFVNASIDKQYFTQAPQDLVSIQVPNGEFWVDYHLPKTNGQFQFQPIQINQHNVMSPVSIPNSREGKLSFIKAHNQINSSHNPSLQQWRHVLTDFDHIYLLEKKDIVSLQYDAYKALEKPTLVLERAYYIAAIQENGKMLSTVSLELPPAYGQHYVFSSPNEATIWSLTVNGKTEQAFQLSTGEWAIPLAKNKQSNIKIEYLEKIKTLTLNGRLPITIPKLGIAAKILSIALALPPSAKLTQVEGNVTSVRQSKNTDTSTTGHSYYLQQTLYEGQAFNIALHYQEPSE